MNPALIQDMIMEILQQVDYDIAKQYDVYTAEEPEFVEEYMNELVKIAEDYIERA